MFRVLPIVGLAAASLGLTGCAGTMDTITSRSFRKDPWNTTVRLVNPEDPLVVLRADPPRTGDERAKAMRRLKEPVRDGRTQQDQDEVIDVLGRAATADPSPVLRLAAVEALGKFDDPRAAGILVIAYQNAHGRPPGSVAPENTGVIQAGSRGPRTVGPDRFPLTGPTGYPADTAATIRCRTLEALGRTGKPEAVRFLATVASAGPKSDTAIEGSDDPDVRHAAVRGLGKCRQPEAVQALAQVLAAEAGKDHVTVAWAHDGLVRLTGKRLPPDPQQWDAVVQAGVVIAPEPGLIQTAFEWVRP